VGEGAGVTAADVDQLACARLMQAAVGCSQSATPDR
jgi:hypothetical protein